MLQTCTKAQQLTRLPVLTRFNSLAWWTTDSGTDDFGMPHPRIFITRGLQPPLARSAAISRSGPVAVVHDHFTSGSGSIPGSGREPCRERRALRQGRLPASGHTTRADPSGSPSAQGLRTAHGTGAGGFPEEPGIGVGGRRLRQLRRRREDVEAPTIGLDRGSLRYVVIA